MTVKTIDLVRKIRDQFHEEMKGKSPHAQAAYIRKKAAEARKKMNRLGSCKGAKAGRP